MKKLFFISAVVVFLLLGIVSGVQNSYSKDNNNNSNNNSQDNNHDNHDNHDDHDDHDDHDRDEDDNQPTVTPTPTPEQKHHFACVDNSCVQVNGEEKNSCEVNKDCAVVTPTPIPTSIPTPTSVPTNTSSGIGGPGDGRSDGLGCASHDCSIISTPQKEVLGVSTGQKRGEVLGASTFAGTGAFDSTMATLEQMFGIFISSIGMLVYGKRKKFQKRE